jgi:parallel beta-helix repeat protein
VAYVDAAGTDNTTCAKATPCTKMASALATNRPMVKVTGTIDEAVSVDTGRVVTFYGATGAALTRGTGTGAILTVKDNGTSLTAFDLEIRNAPNNPSGIGLVIPAASGAPTVTLTKVSVTNNPGGGISASGGSLTLSQCTVSGNGGGGITLAGADFDLTNNIIAQNGGPTSLVGGLQLTTVSGTGTHHVAFNTIAANAGAATVNAGVNCGTVVVPVVFDSDIIYGNTVTGGGKQLAGSPMCTATYSDVGPDGLTGTGNINLDPMFVSLQLGNFHITQGSPAKDAANPAAPLAIDIDGDTRPQGPARDIGADEYKP